MADVVVLTPNPAVDVTYRVDEQRIGETQRVRAVERRPGGKGINVVRVLRTLGVDALALAPLGGAAGAWITDALADLGIPARAVPIAADTRTTVTVVDDLAHPTMLGEPGPLLADAEWEALADATATAVAGARVLVVSGSLPVGADPARVGAWVRIAREAGVRTVVDGSGPALLTAADAGAEVLKPNREELLAATGAASEPEGAAELRRRGARLVVVSHGADGLRAYGDGEPVHVPTVAGVTGNPTGAGDAATAGLVAALLRDDDLATALRTAAAAGAAAVLRPVAGEVDPTDVRRFLADLDPAPGDPDAR
jgi:1-phosphofructokinase family hexose kinase